MSPEFDSWRAFLSTDKIGVEVKEAIEMAVRTDEKEFGARMNSGFLALVVNGELRKVIDTNEASEGVMKNAQQNRGDWILVRGLGDSGRARRRRIKKEENFRKLTLETAHFVPSYDRQSNRRYRGKHRSSNKNSGFQAYFRSSRNKVRR